MPDCSIDVTRSVPTTKHLCCSQARHFKALIVAAPYELIVDSPSAVTDEVLRLYNIPRRANPWQLYYMFPGFTLRSGGIYRYKWATAPDLIVDCAYVIFESKDEAQRCLVSPHVKILMGTHQFSDWVVGSIVLSILVACFILCCC